LEKIFSSSRDSENRQPANPKKVHGKIKKIFYIFITLCLLAFAGVAAYLLVPSAKIILVPNILKNKIEANIHGASDGGTDATNIAVRVLDETQDISLTYEVTGENSVSGKKASGSVVIYNEYSSSSQTLIATTRLQSTDGKIFRLLKNVVVPGTTNVGGTIQPGAIEAEVVADQAGSDFNIDPTDFKIPGFANGPKFDKFYAKSSSSFSGGTSDGTSGGSAKVTQQDIDSAKAKAEAAINDKINSVISGELQTGEVALPQAEKITITKNNNTINYLPFGELDIYTQFLPKDLNPEFKSDILFFGRISAYKGIEYLIEAFRIVKKNYPNLKLIIAGSGKLYFESNLADNDSSVKVINRYITNEELASLISQTRIIVCPYTDATQSGVAMTAFAFNKPVIATDTGGFPDIIIPGKTGFLVPVRDAENLANAIIKILQNPFLEKELSEKIRNFMQTSEFSWASITQKMQSIYQKAMRN